MYLYAHTHIYIYTCIGTYRLTSICMCAKLYTYICEVTVRSFEHYTLELPHHTIHLKASFGENNTCVGSARTIYLRRAVFLI